MWPQWCAALDTFEAMQVSGCRPHAAVFSSIIDVLWQTGIAWAQAKALQLFSAAVQCAPVGCQGEGGVLVSSWGCSVSACRHLGSGIFEGSQGHCMRVRRCFAC